jgi:hypothetical protein
MVFLDLVAEIKKEDQKKRKGRLMFSNQPPFILSAFIVWATVSASLCIALLHFPL